MTIYPGKPCYYVLIGIAVLDFLVLALTNARLDVADIADELIFVLLLISLVLAVARTEFKHPTVERVCKRAANFCQGLVFLQIGWLTIRLFNHLTMKMTAEIDYADGLLVQMDFLIPVGWGAYFELVQSYPAVINMLDRSYTSLTLFSMVAFTAISCFRDIRRSQFFLEAFFFTAVICTAVGMFFPAQGAVMAYLGAAHDFSNFSKAPGLWFVEPLAALRSGQPIMLSVDYLPGLVSFPSFHTAAAIVLAASFWRTVFFLPALIYSAVVIAATPIFGGHYFVDLVGGAVVAVLVVAVLARTNRFRGLLSLRSLRMPPSAVAGGAF